MENCPFFLLFLPAFFFACPKNGWLGMKDEGKREKKTSTGRGGRWTSFMLGEADASVAV